MQSIMALMMQIALPSLRKSTVLLVGVGSDVSFLTQCFDLFCKLACAL
jgi:hypothetical protein